MVYSVNSEPVFSFPQNSLNFENFLNSINSLNCHSPIFPLGLHLHGRTETTIETTFPKILTTIEILARNILETRRRIPIRLHIPVSIPLPLLSTIHIYQHLDNTVSKKEIVALFYLIDESKKGLIRK
jgi:hypothetical protein